MNDLVYPSIPWSKNLVRSPRRHWSSKQNIIEFLEKFAEKYHIKQNSDWQSIAPDLLKNELGGASLQHLFDNSLFKLLSFAYPDTNWSNILTPKPKKEKIKNRNSVVDLVKARKVFDEIGNELGVTEYTGWYKVPISAIRKKTSIIRYFPNKFEAFRSSNIFFDFS